jgi:excisionase family DNA binding protein
LLQHVRALRRGPAGRRPGWHPIRHTDDVRRVSPASDAEWESQFEPDMGRSVSLNHAAQLLNVSRRTIYHRIRAGRLQTVRTMGGAQRVLMDSIYDMGFRQLAFPTSAAAVSFALRPFTRN